MTPPIVVTGASGFIGRTIVDLLVSKNRPVVAISRSYLSYPDGVEVVQTKDYLDDIPHYPEATCIHLAGTRDKTEAAMTVTSHEVEASNIAEALFLKKFKRIVFASTSTVYPQNRSEPCRPGDENKPSDNYARSKLVIEKLVLQQGGAAARLSNIYGQGMAPNCVIADVLGQIPGEPHKPLLVRNVNTIRDFLWIEDVARGLVAIADGNKSGIFNLGSGEAVNIGHIAETALTIAGQKGRHILSTSEDTNTSQIILDLSETQRNFAWQAQTTLQEGLSILIKNSDLE